MWSGACNIMLNIKSKVTFKKVDFHGVSYSRQAICKIRMCYLFIVIRFWKFVSMLCGKNAENIFLTSFDKFALLF